jgi:hypothetical protein
MGEELQVQIGRAPARVAGAARRQRDGAPAARERGVRRLKRGQQCLAVERAARGRDAEHGVALQLCESQRGAQAIGDDPQQIRQDVVRVLELDPGEVGAVAADVGQHEAALAHALGHRARSGYRRAAPRFAAAEAG